MVINTKHIRTGIRPQEAQIGIHPGMFIGGAPCLDFANTVDWHAGGAPEDRLQDYAGLAEWAAAAGVVTQETARRLIRASRVRPGESERVFKRALAFRESMYRILAGIAQGRRPDPKDIAAVNGVIGDALGRLQLRAETGGFRLDWPEGEGKLARVLWPIARSLSDLLAAGDLTRLRQCADDRGCGWLFMDSSRNRSRRWCSMDDCGNRAKAGRHFRRLKERVAS